jgi:hypothetical protein
MGARQKLNEGYFLACLVAAGILGYVTGSGLVFLIALVALVVLCTASGGIRLE